MADERKRILIRQRGSIKHKLTCFTKYVSDHEKAILNEKSVLNLQERIIRAEQFFIEYSECQSEIDALTHDDDIEQEYQTREEFENELYNALASAKHIVSEFQRPKVNFEADSESHQGSDRNANDHSGSLSGVKFPVINLPTFSGQIDQWLEFRDTFESLVHLNNAIADILKYHYLRASLTGGASQVIRSIDLSADNYSIAWQSLCERYNNNRLLKDIHTKALFSLHPIQTENSTKLRELLDYISKHLRSLHQLGEPVEHWDTLINFLVISKLDKTSTREWEQLKTTKEVSTWEDLKTFLRGRADMLEAIESKGTDKGFHQKAPQNQSKSYKSFHTTNVKCPHCKGNHLIYSCDGFKKLSAQDRIDFAKNSKLCLNCLKVGHFEKNCKFGNCRICKNRHNTLLHKDLDESGPNVDVTTGTISMTTSLRDNQVILSTVLLDILDKNQVPKTFRALLDSGSQSSFITREAFETLGLNESKTDFVVQGINNCVSLIKGKCVVQIKSKFSDYRANLMCLIVPQITEYIPIIQINKHSLQIPPNVQLADPSFNKPNKIDILIGADLFWNILCNGQINLGCNKPLMKKTQFGWVVTGQIGSNSSRRTQCNVSTHIDLDEKISKFWELEEISNPKAKSKEENECELHFSRHTKRLSDGRFMVTIPLTQSPDVLGDSKQQAIKRFLSVERKLERNAELKIQYTKFMAEYIEMNHMTPIKEDEHDINSYFMPHHSVLKEDSLTTKLRVVFDASAPSTNGISLNQIQMVGPTIQNDLLSITLRFRAHIYVLSADIAKMYRQVLVVEDQRPLQRIVWRSSVSDSLQVFNLNTVTYGQASSAFLAIRCLFQLAEECESTHPCISSIIRQDFYVDDLLTGTNSKEDAIYIIKAITNILRSGKFELRKWASNDPEILNSVSDSSLTNNVLDIGHNDNAKTLGLIWNPSTDKLMYKISKPLERGIVTKRIILSESAQVFDPLGLLQPCIIIAKIIIQELWLQKTSWDDPVPSSLLDRWLKLREELLILNDLQISRLAFSEAYRSAELHCFSDASEMAYGACAYIRTINDQNIISVRLLCAKAKVAPLKPQSLPRLELCGAIVACRLAKKIVTSLNVNFSHVTFWSDSTIVLGWIKTSPSLLKTFVRNRVGEAQDLPFNCEWRHVSSRNNPSDYLSRGLYPSQIVNNDLWFNGPSWLQGNRNSWPETAPNIKKLPDLKEIKSLSFLNVMDNDFIFERFSDLTKLKRVTAFILRFKTNCLKTKDTRVFGPLSQQEIQSAFLLLIRISQLSFFNKEYVCLQQNKPLNRKSKILSLSPIFDKTNSLIRVGGRLSNSNFNYDKKHPILLHPKHNITKLIFKSEHLRLQHAGAQLLLFTIKESLWPISGRNLAKQTVRNCVTCFKHNPKNIQIKMSDLPASRFVTHTPFYITGTDYGGPFLIKTHKGRNSKLTKCYICLFVCFATKAVHLELVSDLSTEGFILALRRFVSRRGRPTKIYSDNGNNYIGAKNELNELAKFLSINESKLTESISRENIEWSFIPPASPHFGGLWEAGIKSTKYHLKRVMGNASLTFEQFYTLLVQVEAILNSRPLYPLSSDPNDTHPLTPAHFLVGRPLTTVPDPDVTHLATNRLSLHQHIQQIQQHFWRRWSKEYISELQQRQRWHTSSNHLKKDALVLVKDDNLPPMKWRLGRIVKLHPGMDSMSRVATIRTSQGDIKRAYSKICPLPTSE